MNQTPPVLVCLRCSCCSFAVQRAAVLLPLLAVAALPLVYWLQVRGFQDSCATRLETFFAVAALLLAAMWVTALGVVAFTSRQTGAPSLDRRRATRVAVAAAMVTLALASLAWGAVGCMWLLADQPDEQLNCADEMTSETRVSVAELFVVGLLLLATTVCCRPEDFFLASAAPSVDPDMLSPTLPRGRQAVPSYNAAMV